MHRKVKQTELNLTDRCMSDLWRKGKVSKHSFSIASKRLPVETNKEQAAIETGYLRDKKDAEDWISVSSSVEQTCKTDQEGSDDDDSEDPYPSIEQARETAGTESALDYSLPMFPEPSFTKEKNWINSDLSKEKIEFNPQFTSTPKKNITLQSKGYSCTPKSTGDRSFSINAECNETTSKTLDLSEEEIEFNPILSSTPKKNIRLRRKGYHSNRDQRAMQTDNTAYAAEEIPIEIRENYNISKPLPLNDVESDEEGKELQLEIRRRNKTKGVRKREKTVYASQEDMIDNRGTDNLSNILPQNDEEREQVEKTEHAVTRRGKKTKNLNQRKSKLDNAGNVLEENFKEIGRNENILNLLPQDNIESNEVEVEKQVEIRRHKIKPLNRGVRKRDKTVYAYQEDVIDNKGTDNLSNFLPQNEIEKEQVEKTEQTETSTRKKTKSLIQREIKIDNTENILQEDFMEIGRNENISNLLPQDDIESNEVAVDEQVEIRSRKRTKRFGKSNKGVRKRDKTVYVSQEDMIDNRGTENLSNVLPQNDIEREQVEKTEQTETSRRKKTKSLNQRESQINNTGNVLQEDFIEIGRNENILNPLPQDGIESNEVEEEEEEEEVEIRRRKRTKRLSTSSDSDQCKTDATDKKSVTGQNAMNKDLRTQKHRVKREERRKEKDTCCDQNVSIVNKNYFFQTLLERYRQMIAKVPICDIVQTKFNLPLQ